jgi:ActR/RegA family two-component response regulator
VTSVTLWLNPVFYDCINFDGFPIITFPGGSFDVRHVPSAASRVMNRIVSAADGIMTEKLLIIEDEDTLCQSLKRVFMKEGYEVDVAESAETAFDILAAKSYDLIITDIILPGISGIELLARYRKQNPAQKVIIITAYASLETAVESIKAGANDFIIKPLIHDEMKRAVRKVLDQR